ncbi:hypothetical protein PCANC_16662 [Puccinia coronata f. sp. avenae]|uniref:Uncharacterized protein n=1 Tax=Puccinia coronata f. sp. avenae TaxID=200324 RepID=A0A2N5UEI0_9BASI|nr:hypothetical protein PCANC_16662 [Puccinia coronata f. sp. avenae]
MTPLNNNQFVSGCAQFDGTGQTNGRTPFDGLGHTDGRTPFDGLGHTNGRTPFHGPGNTSSGTPFHGPGNTGGGTLFYGPGNTGGVTPFYGPANTGGTTPFNGMGHAGVGTPLDGFGNGSGRTPFDGLGDANGGNLGGPLPALPFCDKNETQESFLAPSQGSPVSGSFRLFYEPGNQPSATQGSQSTVHLVSLQASQASGPPAAHPIPPRVISQSLRNIYFKYAVYIRLVVNDLCRDLPRASTSNRASTGGAKEWDKVSSKGETIWKTPVVNWTWDQFKEGAMKALGQPQDHLDTHLASLDQAGNDEFQPFLEAVVDNPSSKVIIRISMDDPNAQAAKKVQPKSNVEAGKRTEMIAKLRVHIISVYGCNAEALAVRDPDNKNRSIRITRDRLYIWVRALQHNTPDVDFDTPPRGSKFTPEPYAISTIKEIAESPEEKCTNGSTSPKRKFTPARKLPNGRVLPPCLIPNVKNGNTTASSVTLPGPSSDDAASSDEPVVVNNNQSQQATLGAVGESAAHAPRPVPGPSQ